MSIESSQDREETVGAPSRRALLLVAGVAAATLPLAACGQSDATAGAAQADAGENAMGDPNAPVTIIEYASVTCPHCKAFHEDVFPELKTRYIDTGKVRFVFRELPTPPTQLATAGFLIARCAPDDKYFAVLDVLFEKQIPLVQAFQAGTAREELLKIARPLGISDEQFEACIRDQAEIDRIRVGVDEGFDKYKVNSTPSFVIDGKTYAGEMPIERFVELIDPLLEG